MLRIDAVVSPGGTGLIYLTSASRISYGLSKNGYVPAALEDTRIRKVPWIGIIITGIKASMLPMISLRAKGLLTGLPRKVTSHSRLG